LVNHERVVWRAEPRLHDRLRVRWLLLRLLLKACVRGVVARAGSGRRWKLARMRAGVVVVRRRHAVGRHRERAPRQPRRLGRAGRLAMAAHRGGGASGGGRTSAMVGS
jgi:uncharacterized membrane protein YgcG